MDERDAGGRHRRKIGRHDPSEAGHGCALRRKQPGVVLRARIGPRLMPDGQAAVDMAPMVRRDVARIDADRFHGVDRLKHALNLRPAIDAQQDFAAGTDEGKRLIGLRAATARTMSMRETTVPKSLDGPANESEDGAGCGS